MSARSHSTSGELLSFRMGRHFVGAALEVRVWEFNIRFRSTNTPRFREALLVMSYDITNNAKTITRRVVPVVDLNQMLNWNS